MEPINSGNLQFSYYRNVTAKKTKDSQSIIQEIVKNSLLTAYEKIRLDRTFCEAISKPSVPNILFLMVRSIEWTTVVWTSSKLGVAASAYFFAVGCLFEGGMPVFLKNKFSLVPPLSKIFPLQTMARNIFIGLLCFPICSEMMTREDIWVNHFMEQLNLSSANSQDTGTFVASSGIIGIIAIIFACAIAPIGEEVCFRGIINDAFNSTASDKSKEFFYWNKTKTLLKTSLIFGLVHVTPFQGLKNINVFFYTASMGVLLGALANTTGDLWAPTTLHMMNNIFSTMLIRSK